ncbi:MAG TPA: PAS domain S-box protein, partial [Gemmatimonadales bacterium]|nr:PAS domain S-box protein [Gemmatimonadales bacterium]
MPDRSGLSWRRNWTSLQLAMAYALVAGVWIALSAGLIGRWLGAPTLWTGLAIANGLVFVLATASALSVLLDRGTARLIRRERYFRALTERALDVVAVFNRDGAIRFVSPAVRAALGYEPGELEGVAACDLVHPDDRPAVLALLERGAAVPNFTAATELRLRHKDGSWRTVAGTGSNLLHDPVLAGVVVNFRDVTESRRAEAQRDLLAAAVTQAAEAVLITDATGTIVYVNPAFERITGYVVADVLGANPRILKSGRQDASFYRRLWGTLLAGEAWAGRLVNRRKDGSLYEVEAVISPVRDAAGRIAQFVGIQRDVTHERRLEDQLRQAQKLEAVGQLTGGIAHDFNNILAVVLANTELVA